MMMFAIRRSKTKLWKWSFLVQGHFSCSQQARVHQINMLFHSDTWFIDCLDSLEVNLCFCSYLKACKIYLFIGQAAHLQKPTFYNGSNGGISIIRRGKKAF